MLCQNVEQAGRVGGKPGEPVDPVSLGAEIVRLDAAGDPAELVANSDRLQQKLNWKPDYTKLTDIVASAWEFEKKREA